MEHVTHPHEALVLLLRLRSGRLGGSLRRVGRDAARKGRRCLRLPRSLTVPGLWLLTRSLANGEVTGRRSAEVDPGDRSSTAVRRAVSVLHGDAELLLKSFVETQPLGRALRRVPWLRRVTSRVHPGRKRPLAGHEVRVRDGAVRQRSVGWVSAIVVVILTSGRSPPTSRRGVSTVVAVGRRCWAARVPAPGMPVALVFGAVTAGTPVRGRWGASAVW